MNYKEKLLEFQYAVFRKLGDWRHGPYQTFLKDNPAAKLRVALIKEECDELCEALTTGTIQDVRKELCDVLYVVFAAAAIYNFPVDEDFMLVHENNMLKINTGTKADNGKLLKAKDHPKVTFSDYLCSHPHLGKVSP